MKGIIKYFKDLYLILVKIEHHLSKIASCVRTTDRHYGDSNSISTKHWND